MEKNKIEIEIPEGYELDTKFEGDSTTNPDVHFKTLKFKKVEKKAKTWEEIQEYNSKKEKFQYYINDGGEIYHTTNLFDMNSIPTKRDAERVRVLCQLLVIAEYYNEGWVPDWTTDDNTAFSPYWDCPHNVFKMVAHSLCREGILFFKSKETLLEAYNNNKEIFETYLKP